MKLDPLDKLNISEADFSRLVEDLLNTFGWQWCHFRPAKTDKGWRTALSGHQGFPDYIAVEGNRLLFIELKSEKGKVSKAQLEWLEALRKATLEVYVWKPSDYEKVLDILS